MSVLDAVNTLSLTSIFEDEEAALNFVYNFDLLYDDGVCESTPHCSGNYQLVPDTSTKFGFRLKCNVCNKTKSLFYNSVFTRTHLQINKVVHLIYCWSMEYSCEISAHETGVTLSTVTNFFQAFRQACQFWLNQEGQQPIGGVGYNVEIDESIISKRKNNVGRLLNEIWVFGGVCRETHERFVVRVDSRDAGTLLPIIQEMILPGTTIHSDGWAAYNRISTLPEGYIHKVVNHSLNFVDPVTGCHTQTIERMWREVKRIRRRYEGIARVDVDVHLAEYLWREAKNVTKENAFREAIILIGECPYY